MNRKQELYMEEMAQMKIFHSQNMFHRKVADVLQVSHSAVTKELLRMKKLDSLKSITRVGRPRKTSAATDRWIHRAAVAHQTFSWSTIKAEVRPQVSTRTVQRRLLVNFSCHHEDLPRRSS